VLLRWGEEVGILTERLQTRLYVAGKSKKDFSQLFSQQKKVVDFFCDKEVEV
jgi:hypothetical protein